jgi:hypothetical protein
MGKGKRSVALFEVISASKKPRPSFALRAPKLWFNRPKKEKVLSAPVVEQAADSSAPAAPGIDMKLDPERQRITFQVSYTSAIIAAFAVLVAVGLAYIIGSHIRNNSSRGLAGPSTEQLRKGPVHAAVLDVKPPAPLANKTTAPLLEADDAITALPTKTEVPTTEPSAQRVISRNYIVVQIYPEEKNANDARDLLAKNNIPCTVEKGLTGYAAPSWYCVVTLTGFDHIRNNPEYDNYENSIRDLSTKFAGTSKFKKFEPQAYKWKG